MGSYLDADSYVNEGGYEGCYINGGSYLDGGGSVKDLRR